MCASLAEVSERDVKVLLNEAAKSYDEVEKVIGNIRNVLQFTKRQ